MTGLGTRRDTARDIPSGLLALGYSPCGSRRTGRADDSGGRSPAPIRRGSLSPRPSFVNLEAPRFRAPFFSCLSSPGLSCLGRRGGPCPCAPAPAGPCSRGPRDGPASCRGSGRPSDRPSGLDSCSRTARPRERPAIAASSSMARSRSGRGTDSSPAMLSNCGTWRLSASRAVWLGPPNSFGPSGGLLCGGLCGLCGL